MSNITNITSTKDLLCALSEFVKEMNSSNSDLYKAKVFKKYAEKYPDPSAPFLKAIVLINSNLIPFNVTANSLVKFKNDKKKQSKRIKPNVYSDDSNGSGGQLALFKLLDDLNTRKVSGDKAKQTIVSIMNA